MGHGWTLKSTGQHEKWVNSTGRALPCHPSVPYLLLRVTQQPRRISESSLLTGPLWKEATTAQNKNPTSSLLFHDIRYQQYGHR